MASGLLAGMRQRVRDAVNLTAALTDEQCSDIKAVAGVYLHDVPPSWVDSALPF